MPERSATDGAVVRVLDEQTLRKRLAHLATSQPESLTVSLINSFANPAHELRVLEIVQEELPGIPISLSSDILPEIMEYERTMTAVANAYVKPILETYLDGLQAMLDGTALRVLRSDGGLSSAQVAKERCANLLYSVGTSQATLVFYSDLLSRAPQEVSPV